LEEVEAAEAKVQAAEKVAAPMPKSKTMPSTQMIKLADEVDEAIKVAREAHAETKKTTGGLAEGVEQELKLWLTGEVKKLDGKMARFDSRLTKVTSTSTKFHEDAKKKDGEELKIFEKRVIKMLKYHQTAKGGLSNQDLFASIDSNSDGKIELDEFLSFFQTCEKESDKKEEAAEEKKEEATEEKKEEGKEEAKPEAKPAPKAAAKAAAKPAPKEEPLTEEDLTRAFTYLDDDEEAFLDKEKFCNLVRQFLKVAKDTVVTAGLSIKESKTLRRLEVGEVVEILEGPQEEETVKVMRLKVKVMKDDLEGWVTKSGNQGTMFLEDGGNTFKVIAETILTETFALDGTGAKASTRKLKDLTRKLKVKEIVEVREWPKKEEKSGLMRMKCKTRSDGITGWVTTVGNQGTVYLEVV